MVFVVIVVVVVIVGNFVFMFLDLRADFYIISSSLSRVTRPWFQSNDNFHLLVTVMRHNHLCILVNMEFISAEITKPISFYGCFFFCPQKESIMRFHRSKFTFDTIDSFGV